jgi:hypothetical protein
MVPPLEGEGGLQWKQMVPHTGSGGGTRGGEEPLARSRMDEDAANREILPGGIGRRSRGSVAAGDGAAQWKAWCLRVEQMVPPNGRRRCATVEAMVRDSGSDGAP